MSRKAVVAAAATAMIVAAVVVWFTVGQSFFASSDDSTPMICSGGQCCCRRGKTFTGGVDAAGNRLTLDPNQFVGPVKEAYQFAAAHPDLISHLWCYCGCDKTDGHRSLLDCYRGNHGAICAICNGEALMARQMSEQGSPVDQIRDAIRDRYSAAE